MQKYFTARWDSLWTTAFPSIRPPPSQDNRVSAASTPCSSSVSTHFGKIRQKGLRKDPWIKGGTESIVKRSVTMTTEQCAAYIKMQSNKRMIAIRKKSNRSTENIGIYAIMYALPQETIHVSLKSLSRQTTNVSKFQNELPIMWWESSRREKARKKDT